MISPQAQSLLAREVQLTQALAATKEVGGLLLKRETEDLRAISSKTEELLAKYRCACMQLIAERICLGYARMSPGSKTPG